MYNKNIEFSEKAFQMGGNQPHGNTNQKRAQFMVTQLGVCAVLVLMLVITGFYPELPKEDVTAAVAGHPASAGIQSDAEAVAQKADDRAPVRVIIESIDVDVPVNVPVSTDLAVLDAALLTGAVQYPGSASLDENDNMLLFAHSSYLPVVHNPAFRAFNGLSKLEKGSIVKVQSATGEHVYRVSAVAMVRADDAIVDMHTGRKMLTLVTCNTFGEKSDRFMVTAEFVGSYPISA
jgi:LPXTG-site transpeptidase (sortase) family protein